MSGINPVAWHVFADTEKWVTMDEDEADENRDDGCEVRPLVFGDLPSDHEAEIARLRAEVEENEKAINVWRGRTQRAEAEVDELRKQLGETAQCLADVSNDVGGWAVEEVIQSAMNAAMGEGK